MPRGVSHLSLSAEEKLSQQEDVENIILETKLLPVELVKDEVSWFYEQLGIDDAYFDQESDESIARHIMLLYSAKMDAVIQSTKDLLVDLHDEWDDHALYIHSDIPGVQKYIHKADIYIDKKYLDRTDAAFRVEAYLSTGMASYNMKTRLRCFFVNKCVFANPNPTEEEKRKIDQVADVSLLGKISPATKALYESMMNRVLDRRGVVTEVSHSTSCDSKRLSIAYRTGSTEMFMGATKDLFYHYGFYSKKKFVENFSNGVTIMTIYLSPVKGKAVDEATIESVIKEISMIYCMPVSFFQDLFRNGDLNAQELTYATSACIFAQHFLNRLGKEYWNVKDMLVSDNPMHQKLLTKLKKRLRSETFTVESIKDTIKRYPQLIKLLYVNFALAHYLRPRRESIFSTSLFDMAVKQELDPEELAEKIRSTVSGENERAVFEAFLTFNNNIVKTNFYNPSKIAFSFKLKCDFLPEAEYQFRPYGMYLVIGSEFRGFHVRFQDIARGGIRIVRSRNPELYGINRRYLFDENYALASTQTRKNKDIPEGGSKGTILLDANKQDCAQVAFEKYIDSMLDLLVEDKGRRSSNKTSSHPEILFFGPDEGTADYMDWASEHAKGRGLSYWKAITTGKSQSRGGIPHDTYGMTTRSVDRYVQGIYTKLGLNEDEISKFQTGGPDGDLGSNEIKISKDMTIGVVDGSGVLYDPAGIDRAELLRLANERKMVSSFDKDLLSDGGFLVLVDDTNIQLPDGTPVTSGLEFRNNFHLNELSTADIFVPCGGRPESVDINNYHSLLWEDGTPRFDYIVEGANLFFTQEARIRLEKAGCIIFKDASANKGGVTSSSLEVLAALVFTDAEFEANMAVKNGVIPDFYRDYVIAVQDFIAENADLEFECIWREAEKFPEKTKSEISDELSLAILDLNIQLQEEDELWRNEELRMAVLKEAFPDLLQQKLGGIEVILKRLPENYQKALFGSFLASRFVYEYGIQPTQMAFFDYMAEYMEICMDDRRLSVETRLRKDLNGLKLT